METTHEESFKIRYAGPARNPIIPAIKSSLKLFAVFLSNTPRVFFLRKNTVKNKVLNN